MKDNEILYCGICRHFSFLHGSAGICDIKKCRCGENLVDVKSDICERFSVEEGK